MSQPGEFGAAAPVRKDPELAVICNAVACENARGDLTVRFVAIKDMPQWPSGYFAEVAWGFLKGWLQDAGTGEVVYAERE